MSTEVAAPADKPVRRGQFYGSAACCHGRLCTLAAYEQAVAEARALAKHLGAGWEVRVHENLGWFYSVSLASGENTLTVHPSTSGEHTSGGWKVRGYGASFNGRPWHNDKTPEGAVIKVIAEIRAEMDSLGAVLAVASASRLFLPASTDGPTTGGEA